MTPPLVCVEGLHREFQGPLDWRRLARLRWERRGEAAPLRGVTFSVDAGEWLAIIGGNGAGKTTVLKVIAGLLLPSSGRVVVDGIDVVRHPRRVQAMVGYALADERSFFWRLNLLDNLEFFATLVGVPRRERRARSEHLLERLDLAAHAERPFAALSTGMKQRLTIARALLGRPRVLLLDEPTRSLDGEHARQVWSVVRDEMQATGGSVLLVTHQLEDAVSQCHRVATLHDGVIALESTADQLRERASGSHGLIIAVRDLPRPMLARLRDFEGVRDIRVASENAGEQVLEVWTRNGDLPLAGFIGELTSSGASIASLQQGIPLQAVLEQLQAGVPQEVPA